MDTLGDGRPGGGPGHVLIIRCERGPHGGTRGACRNCFPGLPYENSGQEPGNMQPAIPMIFGTISGFTATCVRGCWASCPAQLWWKTSASELRRPTQPPTCADRSLRNPWSSPSYILARSSRIWSPKHAHRNVFSRDRTSLFAQSGDSGSGVVGSADHLPVESPLVADVS